MSDRQTYNEEQFYTMQPVSGLTDFTFARTPDGPTFNFPHRIVYHSPTGMEFGYGGSGPADAALNVLIHFVDGYTAFRLHQDFKWKFIATLDQENGGIINAAQILPWIKEQLGRD